SVEERRALLPGDPRQDAHLPEGAHDAAQLACVCPAYRAGDSVERGSGTVGVAAPWLKRHVGISLAMVRSAAGRASSRGVERLLAEVDADAPESVYLFADLPGRVVESLVSLMYVPEWSATLGLREH